MSAGILRDERISMRLRDVQSSMIVEIGSRKNDDEKFKRRWKEEHRKTEKYKW